MGFARTFRIGIATVGVCATLTACAAVEDLSAAPPSGSAIPGTTTSSAADEQAARAWLDQLTVEPEGTLDGYDRDEFPHWSAQGDNCDTREVVLRRDGDDVRTGDDCYPISGTWHSPFDGETWSDPSDVDIDHVVPLAEAWRTGASAWTTDDRERFANDLDGVNLLAVTDNVNQSKGDKGPEEWLPPREAFHCTYAMLWIEVKHTWELTVERAEKAALEDMLDRC